MHGPLHCVCVCACKPVCGNHLHHLPHLPRSTCSATAWSPQSLQVALLKRCLVSKIGQVGQRHVARESESEPAAQLQMWCCGLGGVICLACSSALLWVSNLCERFVAARGRGGGCVDAFAMSKRRQAKNNLWQLHMAGNKLGQVQNNNEHGGRMPFAAATADANGGEGQRNLAAAWASTVFPLLQLLQRKVLLTCFY